MRVFWWAETDANQAPAGRTAEASRGVRVGLLLVTALMVLLLLAAPASAGVEIELVSEPVQANWLYFQLYSGAYYHKLQTGYVQFKARPTSGTVWTDVVRIGLKCDWHGAAGRLVEPQNHSTDYTWGALVVERTSFTGPDGSGWYTSPQLSTTAVIMRPASNSTAAAQTDWEASDDDWYYRTSTTQVSATVSLPIPSISTVDPNPADQGALVTMTGSNFGASGTLVLRRSDDSTDTTMTATGWTDSEVKFRVPDEQRKGAYSLRLTTGAYTATTDFTVNDVEETAWWDVIGHLEDAIHALFYPEEDWAAEWELLKNGTADKFPFVLGAALAGVSDAYDANGPGTITQGNGLAITVPGWLQGDSQEHTYAVEPPESWTETHLGWRILNAVFMLGMVLMMARRFLPKVSGS